MDFHRRMIVENCLYIIIYKYKKEKKKNSQRHKTLEDVSFCGGVGAQLLAIPALKGFHTFIGATVAL